MNVCVHVHVYKIKNVKKPKSKILGIKSRFKCASFGSDQTVILDFPAKGTHFRFMYWEELYSYKLHQLILTHRCKLASIEALLLPPLSPFRLCNFHTDSKYHNIPCT